MTKRKSQSEHDKMAKTVADHFIKKNEPNVKADISGYKKPLVIKWKGQESGHIPDITTHDGKQYRYIVEVETDDSINDSHTEDQWKLFSACADQNNAKFLIVVPNNSKSKAEKRKTELGIKNGDIVGL